MRYRFGDYTLDTQRHELNHGSQPIKLRRKVFQVLAYLLAHRERVVSKQELLAQLWPKQFVGDETLTSCIKTLRKALGERGRNASFVRTLHGHGYRFVAPVEAWEHPPVDMTAPPSGSPLSAVRSTVAPVGRQEELTRLHAWLAQARGGVRQVVFVTGEAGLGKTTLVEAFMEEIGTHSSIGIGRGLCVEHYGAAEAYLPVLEALGRLCRGSGGRRLVALLGQQAPTWLVQMADLVHSDDLETLRRRIVGATRDRMLRELAEALELLTAQQPLVLVLEDLHWSDPSTLDLISVLARRREAARLLLIATYRPPEVRRRPHPLYTLQQELQMHGHSVELPLTLLAEDAVATYLAGRLPGLQRVGRLARLVHQRTEGNPLFMVALVDSWLTQGVLLEHDGVWALPDAIEGLRDRVPDSLQQMIDIQLDWLSSDEQRVLEVASVAGVEFSAAAVAAGLAREAECVDESCASLARRQQFVRAGGARTWPDGTVAGGYRFVHALYQQVLYQRISAARRVRLHQRIGARLEAGYGAQASAMATELALHFERGRDPQRAVQYLWQAGQLNIERSAYVEAVAQLTAALELLKILPDTTERSQQELMLHIALGAALLVTKGHAASEVEQAYSRAYALCQQVGEAPQLAQALFGLWRFYIAQPQLHMAREIGETLLRLGQHSYDPSLPVIAHCALGITSMWLGALHAARMHMEECIARYTPDQGQSMAFRIGQDPGVNCRAYAAIILCLLGYPDQALARLHESLRLAHELSHPFSLAYAWLVAAIVSQLRRDVTAVQRYAEACIALSIEQGFPFWAAEGTVYRGWALSMQGQGEEGMAQIRQGIAAWRATGATLFVPYLCTVLAEASAHLDHTGDGLQILTEAHTLVEQHEERFWEAEIARLRGVLLLRQAGTPQGEAETWLRHALGVARRQEAKLLELRTAVSLSRLWRLQGKKAEAREVLTSIYSWFTEGFDTADLRQAKVLLEELR